MTDRRAGGLGASDIRSTNRKIVLRCIWLGQPISRAEVARATRINRSSVSGIVNELLDEGLILEKEAKTIQVGRTPLHITINPGRHYFLALDLRPRSATVALYDLVGRRTAESRLSIPAPSESPKNILEAAADEMLALCRRKKVPLGSLRAFGAAVPGQVAREEGLVISSPGLGWRDVPVADIVLGRLGRKIEAYVDNSANQALRAELWRGDSIPENLTGVYVDVNESVETGIILDGKILSGRKTGMGSFGRTHLAPAGPGDSRGTIMWEELVSLPALVRRFKGGGIVPGDDLPNDLVDFRDACLGGDSKALHLAAEEADWMGIGIANALNALGLPTLVVGGYIRSIWDLLEARLCRLCETLTDGRYPGTQQIRLGSFSGPEPLEGAALAAIGRVIPLELLSLLTNEQKRLIESKVLSS